MQLFDLPLEIFRSIMDALVLSSVQQAMRARLVCKTFSVELLRAVCDTRILEIPAYKKRYVDLSLLSEYLFTRIQRNDASGYLTIEHLSQIVDYILEQMPQIRHQRPHYIRRLCDRTIEIHHCPSNRRRFASFRRIVNIISYERRPLEYWNDATQSIRQNALAAAICLGLASLAKTMIEDGVKDSKTYFGTSLLCAIKRDDLDLTILLLERGGSELSWEALEQAARNGNEPMLRLLLDPKYNSKGWESSDYLHAIEGAAAGGNWNTIDFLIQMAISDNKLEDKKRLKLDNRLTMHSVYNAVLLIAAFHDQKDIVQAALDCGADPHVGSTIRFDPRRSALLEATKNGFEGIVKLLLERGANDPKDDLEDALFMAILKDRLRIVQMFLDYGAEVQPATWSDMTRPIFAAARFMRTDILKLLLDTGGADLTADSDVCKAAYSLAVSQGNTIIMRQFEERGLVAKTSPDSAVDRA